MKRTMVILLMLAGVVMISVPVMATTTRDMGMGLFEYPWFVDGLQSYIYENPAYLDRFKERAYAERIGIEEGRNQGGIIFNPAGKVTLGFHFGVPVDTNMWNTTNVDGLFHVDTYSIHAKSKYNHSVEVAQALQGYQVELLDRSIIDLKDPVDASYPVGSSALAADISPDLREQLGQNNFSAMFSYNLGRFIIGADFGYATSWRNNTAGSSGAKEEYNLVNTEYSAKVGAMIQVNTQVSVDVVGNINIYSLDNNVSQAKTNINIDASYGTKGAMDFGGSARVNYQMTTKHKMHFNVGYSMLNRTTEGSMKIVDLANSANNVDASDTFERTGQIIQIGVSDEYAIDNNVRAFMGFNTMMETMTNNYYGDDKIVVANNVDKYSKEYSAIKVPLIVGMEAKLTENWRGRFGVLQTIYQPLSNEGKSITSQGATTTPASVNEISSAETAFSMGLSYKLNNFTFDWLANIELFTVGPNFISGKAWTSQQQNPMAMAFAVTYVFSSDEENKGSGTVLSPK